MESYQILTTLFEPLDPAAPEAIHIVCATCALLNLILKYYQHSLMVANHVGNEDSILSQMLLAKWKEELLTFTLLYLIINYYRCRHRVENYVSSSGWVKH